ncbi:MAG: hypothetical protein EZS28_000540 [Streblomastix strix]|uniref:Uncharacterized protein n=1 Tax=Streblomastix strix TaxID=222440 RepID=A0A5J4X9Q1_9EUKA|nr:MAG: hypothetical protein EZS28_000540 [Streblomastix strix]
MNQAKTLKNLMENGTPIEYYNDGYIMQVKDKIKVYEERKKSVWTPTQAQQTKLLLEARGGGQTKPKRAAKCQIEQSLETRRSQSPMKLDRYRSQYLDEEDDEFSQNERKFQQTELLYSDDEETKQTIIEKPVKTPKPTPQKTIKKPQINYTSPQVDLEELIRLRTENSFIKQQHQDSVKQIEKYKAKIKCYKQKKYQEEQEQQRAILESAKLPKPNPVQKQEQEYVQEIQFRDCDLI